MGAAAVGGLIGGVAVVVGVVLAHLLERRRENWLEIQRSLAKLDIAVRAATFAIFDPQARQAVHLPSWGHTCEIATTALGELNMYARGRDERKQRLRAEAQKMNVVFTAAVGTMATGRIPEEKELLSLTSGLRNMHDLAFGPGTPQLKDPADFDRQVAFLRDHGLDSDLPDL